MARKIKTANEMFDLLGSMQGGSYVTICHVDYAKIDNPKKQIINPITKRKNSVVDFDTIGNNLDVQGLSAIISITRYRQLNWLPQSQLGAKYGAYRTQVNNIRKDFGVPEMKHKQSPYQTMKYGNGISVGNTPNIQGRAYTHQNTFNANKDVTYYGVDNIGHVLKKFTLEELKGYLGNKRDINGLKQLQKLTQDQKVIDDYIKKILDLKMEYTTFLDDRIIYMIGSANNEKFFFTNDNLASSINDIHIRPSEFMAIARAIYHTDYQIMNEQVSKYNMITENILKQYHTYYFDSTDWDSPTIENEKGRQVKIDLSCGNDNLISIIELKGKLYYSDGGESHYGAIINALLKIHHLKNIEQLEKKFGETIDDICEDVRTRCTFESRFYKNINLVMCDKNDSHINQIAHDLSIPLNQIFALDYEQEKNGMPQIIQLNSEHQTMNEQVSKYNMITENNLKDRHLAEFGLTREDYENFMIYRVNKLEEMYGENYEEYSERFDGYARKYMGMRENKYNKQNIIKENALNKKSNICIQVLSISDMRYVAEYIQKTFEPNENIENITDMLNNSNINLQYSTKAINDKGEIIGICLLSNETIDEETDGEFSQTLPQLNQELNKFNYLTMFMIGINREYSRKGLLNHTDLLSTSMNYIKGFDFLVVPIMNELTTHKLWGRYGTIQFFKNSEETLYLIPYNEEVKIIINKFQKNMKRQVIRLTESDLHRVIKESVKRVLAEGQGWNHFKSYGKSIMNGDFDDSLKNQDWDKEWHDGTVDTWNKTGSATGNGNFYDEDGDYTETNPNGEYKPINKGLSGHIGRKAATMATHALGKARRAYKGFNK